MKGMKVLGAALVAVMFAGCGGDADMANPVSYTHLTLPTNREV